MYAQLIVPVKRQEVLFDIAEFRGVSRDYVEQGIKTLALPDERYWSPENREHLLTIEMYSPQGGHYLVNLYEPNMEKVIARHTRRKGVRQKPVGILIRIPMEQLVKGDELTEFFNFELLYHEITQALAQVYLKTAEEIRELLMPIAEILLKIPLYRDLSIWHHEGSTIMLKLVDSPFHENYYEQLHKWNLTRDGKSIIGSPVYPTFEYHPSIDLHLSVHSGKYSYACERVLHLEALEEVFFANFENVTLTV